MAIVKLTQVIRQPIGKVFNVVVDVAGFPRWNPSTPSARKLSSEPTGEGTLFELEIRGLGKVLQELKEYQPNKQVRLVPKMRILTGGHRFIFTAEQGDTRVDHELEMTPTGWFRIFSPLMGIMGRKSLRDLANALKTYLERA